MSPNSLLPFLLHTSVLSLSSVSFFFARFSFFSLTHIFFSPLLFPSLHLLLAFLPHPLSLFPFLHPLIPPRPFLPRHVSCHPLLSFSLLLSTFPPFFASYPSPSSLSFLPFSSLTSLLVPPRLSFHSLFPPSLPSPYSSLSFLPISPSLFPFLPFILPLPILPLPLSHFFFLSSSVIPLTSSYHSFFTLLPPSPPLHPSFPQQDFYYGKAC